MLLDKLKMEFLGSFIMVYASGVALVNYSSGATDKISVGLTNFFATLVMIWIGKNISFAQYNPMVTLAFVLSKHISSDKAVYIVGAQSIGAILALSFLKLTLPVEILNAVNQTSLLGFPLKPIPLVMGLIFELVGTFFLVVSYYLFMIEQTAAKNAYAACIGGVAFIVTLGLLDRTGCGLNPIRMFCYSIISGEYRNLVIYIVGPVIGAVLASLFGEYVITEKASEAKKRRKAEKRRAIAEMKFD